MINSKQDDLLETTEINITGDNFSYSESKNRRSRKLNSLLDVFDEDIYPSSMKKVDEYQEIEETNEVVLTDSNIDLQPTEDVTEVFTLNDISSSVNSDEKIIIDENVSLYNSFSFSSPSPENSYFTVISYIVSSIVPFLNSAQLPIYEDDSFISASPSGEYRRRWRRRNCQRQPQTAPDLPHCQ